MPTLADYRTDTRRLLRSTDESTWTTPDLNAFVVRAVQQRDLDLKLNRAVYRFTLTAGQTTYSLAGIKTGGTLVLGSTTLTPMDVISAILIVSGTPPAGYRAPISRRPYSWLSAYTSTSWTSYPVFFALHGVDALLVAPPPAQAYQTEWDLVGYAPPLVNDTDADPLPYPFTDPIPFLAAHFAKVQAQRFDEAGAFLQLYRDRIAMVRTESRALQMPDPWFGLWRWGRP